MDTEFQHMPCHLPCKRRIQFPNPSLNVWTISYGFSPRDSNQEPSLTYQTEHQHESSPRKRLVIEFKCRSEYYPCKL
ncbi:hypothetical protein DPMN_193728 [Dreissena polymorpha]|uniref:Uncharacterized protein n=1 Tax=Dreissena polymorpha TaxID=45954 RepID=A0A9D3XZY8_DREPO|nr:hypothetical protein DPMN_193728 [Dreissena polymorpha]